MEVDAQLPAENPHSRLNGGNGLKAFFSAILQGKLRAAKEILKQGADPDVCDGSGKTVLHYACWFGMIKRVRLLLRYEADPNLQDPDGRSPLHFACFSGREDIVKELIMCNANMDLLTNRGNSILHYACLKGQANVTGLLLKAGAHLMNIVNHSGKTALHVSCERRHEHCTVELVYWGAIVNMRDKCGKLPADYEPNMKALIEKAMQRDTEQSSLITNKGKKMPEEEKETFNVGGKDINPKVAKLERQGVEKSDTERKEHYFSLKERDFDSLKEYMEKLSLAFHEVQTKYSKLERQVQILQEADAKQSSTISDQRRYIMNLKKRIVCLENDVKHTNTIGKLCTEISNQYQRLNTDYTQLNERITTMTESEAEICALNERYMAFDRKLFQDIVHTRDKESFGELSKSSKLTILHPSFCDKIDTGQKQKTNPMYQKFIEERNLLYLIKNNPSYLRNPKKLKLYCLDIIRGLYVLHEQGKIHGALYPSSVVLNQFARAEILMIKNSVEDIDLSMYQAPEVRNGEIGDSASDIFSFGALLVFLLTTNHQHPALIPATSQNIDYDKEEKQYNDVSYDFIIPEIKDLALLCLASNPSRRPRAADLLATFVRYAKLSSQTIYKQDLEDTVVISLGSAFQRVEKRIHFARSHLRNLPVE